MDLRIRPWTPWTPRPIRSGAPAAGWLAGCLVGWLAGWLAACLPGCLPGWLAVVIRICATGLLVLNGKKVATTHSLFISNCFFVRHRRPPGSRGAKFLISYFLISRRSLIFSPPPRQGTHFLLLRFLKLRRGVYQLISDALN